MSSIKPLSGEEKTVAGSVVALALTVLAFSVGLVKCGKDGDGVLGAGKLASELKDADLLESASAGTAGLVAAGESGGFDHADLLAAEKEVSSLEKQLDQALLENKELNEKLAASLEAASRKAKDTSRSAGLAAAVPAVAATGDDQSGALKQEIAGLKAQLESQNSGSTNQAGGELAEMKNKFERLRTVNDELQRKNSDLEEKLRELSEGAAAGGAQANSDIEAALKANEAEWRKKLVKAEMDKAAQVEELQRKIRSMEMNAPQDKDAPVFVKSTDGLPFAAQQLYGELKKIESMTDPDMEKVYGVIKKKCGGVSKGRVKFATGKTSLGPQGRGTVDDVVANVGEGSMLLVVGFADNSGNSAGNEKLSSARATSVAKRLISKLPKGQRIKAVYVGETERFGPQKENRVVEVWEIAK